MITIVFTSGALIRWPGSSLLLLVPLSSFIEAAIALDNYIHPPRLPLHKPSWKAELMIHPSLIQSDSLNSSVPDTELPLSPLGTASLTGWLILGFGLGSKEWLQVFF